MTGGKAAGWHRERIKADLRVRFGTLRALCRAWEYAPGTISAVLRWPGQSEAIERRIAEALGEHPHTLWPARFTPEGESRPQPVNGGEPIRPRSRPHRQIREAA